MSSGTEIIHAALKNNGAHSVAASAIEDAVTDAMHALNSLVQGWESINIKTGMVPLSAPGDELSEPLDIRQAVINVLSVEISPPYSSGKQVVSPALQRNATRGENLIKKLYQVISIPRKKASTTMPLGEGNNRGNYWHGQTFAGEDFRIGED